MANIMIGANTEILIEILRAVSEIHDSVEQLKGSMKQLEVDIAEIKQKLNTEIIEEESGECCYDY